MIFYGNTSRAEYRSSQVSKVAAVCIFGSGLNLLQNVSAKHKQNIYFIDHFGLAKVSEEAADVLDINDLIIIYI